MSASETSLCLCVRTGCPLILTDMDAVEKMESLSKAEREFLCTLLFHTINWFREVAACCSCQMGWNVFFFPPPRRFCFLFCLYVTKFEKELMNVSSWNFYSVSIF